MKRGTRLELTIDALDGANGVATHEGRRVEVAGAAPGDVVRAEVVHVSPHTGTAIAELSEAVSRGPAYTRPACHHAAPLRGKCSGCPLMHVSPAVQLETKRAAAEAALAGLPVVSHAAPESLAYRNRSNFELWQTPKRVRRLGSKRMRSAELARMDGCMVVHPAVARTADRVAEFADELGVPDRGARGGLAACSVRVDREGNGVVELITNGRHDRSVEALADQLHALPSIRGVSVSHRTVNDNRVRQHPARPIAGTPELDVETNGLSFPVGSDTFFQLNFAVAETIWAHLRGRVDALVGDDAALWDLYCGVGVAGLVAASGTRRRVFGAELGSEAAARAREAAERAGVDATYEAADLGDAPPASWGAPDVVIVDPPRKGLSEAVRERLHGLAAPVVYMSCDTRSLARDVAWFRERGWAAEDAAIYEMLPNTTHAELLLTLRPPA